MRGLYYYKEDGAIPRRLGRQYENLINECIQKVHSPSPDAGMISKLIWYYDANSSFDQYGNDLGAVFFFGMLPHGWSIRYLPPQDPAQRRIRDKGKAAWGTVKVGGSEIFGGSTHDANGRRHGGQRRPRKHRKQQEPWCCVM